MHYVLGLQFQTDLNPKLQFDSLTPNGDPIRLRSSSLGSSNSTGRCNVSSITFAIPHYFCHCPVWRGASSYLLQTGRFVRLHCEGKLGCDLVSESPGAIDILPGAPRRSDIHDEFSPGAAAPCLSSKRAAGVSGLAGAAAASQH